MSNIENNKVFEVISKHTGLGRDAIFLNSRLESDLGCTGDDATELLEELREIFDIDFTGVNIDDFISPEVEGILGFIFNRAQVNHRKAFPVTVLHIIEISNKGKWFAPAQVRKI